MLALDIQPTDYTYTQLMLAYAKNNNLEKVLELEKEATEKYKILPSVYRLNSVLMAYSRLGRAQEADRFIIDMRE
jgi:pentatricopeptide repeat protein